MNPQVFAYHGAGYVGLTGAVHAAQAGHQVLLYDPDQRVINALRAGKPRAGEFLAYLNASVESLVAEGSLIPTCHFGDTLRANVHVLAVPTERAGNPDMSIVLGVLARLFESISYGTSIQIESTLMPGTIDQFLRAVPTRWEQVSQHSIHVSVTPRRDWFADREKNLRTLPRIVGGVQSCCSTAAMFNLRGISDALLATDYRTAELTKSLENALLHGMIALCDELCEAYPDHDVASAVRLATTHWRLPNMFVGLGAGGRCVPLGSEYLVLGATDDLRLRMAEQAMLTEARHREATAKAILSRLKSTSSEHPTGQVWVLGIAYRPDFRDAGRSPGLALARELQAQDANVTVAIADPEFGGGELVTMGFAALTDILGTNSGPEVIVLATPHTDYLQLPDKFWSLPWWENVKIIFDAQGAWEQDYKRLFEASGKEYVRIGKPGWLRRNE